jgi:hypothetical protein
MPSITNLGLSPVFGSGGVNWASYWITRLDTWIKGRSELTMPATIGSNATILPVCGRTNGTDSFIKAPASTKDLTFTEFTLEWYGKFPSIPQGSVNIFGRNAAGFTNGDLMIFIKAGSSPTTMKVTAQNFSTAYEIVSDIDLTAEGAIDIPYHIIYTQPVSGDATLYINGSSEGTASNKAVLASATEPFSLGAYVTAGTPSGFSKMETYTARIYNVALTSEELTARGALTDVTRGLILAWDFMGDNTSVMEPDRSAQSNHGTWVGTAPYYTYSANGCQDNLNNGYKQYRKIGQFPICLPKLIGSEGYPVGMSFPDGYTEFKEVDGQTLRHNLAGSKIRFPNETVWDRSNTTTNNAQSKAATSYDFANVTDWHVWEVANYNIITSYLNTGYQGRFASKVINIVDPDGIFRPTNIQEVLLTLNNLTGADLTKLSQYTNND